MGYVIADRVKETTTTTGTGTVTLLGAVSGFKTFASRMDAGDDFLYCIVLGAEWEVGVGSLATATTLARDEVIASSNADALVSFAAGTKEVFITAPARELATLGQDYAMAGGMALQ